jgi:hypothetical protein
MALVVLQLLTDINRHTYISDMMFNSSKILLIKQSFYLFIYSLLFKICPTRMMCPNGSPFQFNWHKLLHIILLLPHSWLGISKALVEEKYLYLFYLLKTVAEESYKYLMKPVCWGKICWRMVSQSQGFLQLCPCLSYFPSSIPLGKGRKFLNFVGW